METHRCKDFLRGFREHVRAFWGTSSSEKRQRELLGAVETLRFVVVQLLKDACLLYTSDAADE